MNTKDIRYLRWAMLILGCFLSGHVSAQSTRYAQTLLWTRYYLRLKTGVDRSWHAELDNRYFFQPEGHHHQIITHLHYHFPLGKKFEAWAGASYSTVSAQRPELDGQVAVPEYRLWQALSHRHRVRPVFFTHRLRWEERFIHRGSHNGLQSGSRFVYRIRYMAVAQIPLVKGLDFKIGDEVMGQTGEGVKQFFDQNRLWAGLEYAVLPKRLQLEMLYLWLWQQNAPTVSYDRDVFRVTLSQTVQW